jgi:hypothetical protein
MKMSKEDFTKLQTAADIQWPRSAASGLMTNSSVALGLAIIGADYVLSNGAVIVNPGTVNHEKNDKKKG